MLDEIRRDVEGALSQNGDKVGKGRLTSSARHVGGCVVEWCSRREEGKQRPAARRGGVRGRGTGEGRGVGGRVGRKGKKRRGAGKYDGRGSLFACACGWTGGCVGGWVCVRVCECECECV